MTKIDYILVLIEKGDMASIFSRQSFQETLNELLKYGLAEMRNGKIYLTEKGIEAKSLGFEQTLSRYQMEHEMIDFSNHTGKKGRTFFLISLFLFISYLLIMLLIEIGGYTLVQQ